MKLSLGLIIAIILLVYWWVKDHPQPAQPQPEPARQGWYQDVTVKAV